MDDGYVDIVENCTKSVRTFKSVSENLLLVYAFLKVAALAEKVELMTGNMDW